MDQADSLLRFKVLYTHQKVKKAKTWQDGFLDYKIKNKKAILSSEDQKTLDAIFLKVDDVYEDAELESDKYLIQVESLLSKDEPHPHPGTDNSTTTAGSKKENISANQNLRISDHGKERKSQKPYFRAPSIVKNSLNRDSLIKRKDAAIVRNQNTSTTTPMNISHRRPFNTIGKSVPYHQGYDLVTRDCSSSASNQLLSVTAAENRSSSSIRGPENGSFSSVWGAENRSSASSFSATRESKGTKIPTAESIENSVSIVIGDNKRLVKRLSSDLVVCQLNPHSNSKRTVSDMLALFSDENDGEEADQSDNPDLSGEVTGNSTNFSNFSKYNNDHQSRDLAENENSNSNSENSNIPIIPQNNNHHHDLSTDLVETVTPNPQHGETVTTPQNDYFPESGSDKKQKKFSFDLWMDGETNEQQRIENDDSSNTNSFPSKRRRHTGEEIVETTFPKASTSSRHLYVPIQRPYAGILSASAPGLGVGAPLKSPSSFRSPFLSNSKSLFRSPSVHLATSLYRFPAKEECQKQLQQQQMLKREIKIPITYDSATDYKRIFKMALQEHLNILLYDLAVRYHRALNSVDVSAIESTTRMTSTTPLDSSGCGNDGPRCKHKQPAVMRTVRKEGNNKGRMFYACAETADRKCNFFIWADSNSNKNNSNNNDNNSNNDNVKKHSIKDTRSLTNFLNGYSIQLYCGVKIARKSFGGFNNSRYQRGRRGRHGGGTTSDAPIKKKLFIVLPTKKASSFYTKGDIWVVSKHLDFSEGGSSTFIARSVFYGPSSSCELEISPLASYAMSNWPNGEQCYAIHAYNATTELTCIENLDSHVNTIDVPVMSSLLDNTKLNAEIPLVPQYSQSRFSLFCLPLSEVSIVVRTFAKRYSLNNDQESALHNISHLFAVGKHEKLSLIHGVFGAGKSFLLSVVVLFLLQLFEMIETRHGLDYKLKLVIASTTNVAVDRVLSCLSSHHGYEEFVRVGSLKKIAKVILPFSLHADEHEDQEMKELNDILHSDLSETEKGYVKKAIELHKQGVNRKRLDDVRVVGVTCAACVFPLLQKRSFQVHLLDECSQMIEPLTMVPVARFRCQRLVLVGDPNQLSPTIQGSESAHADGLEMTMFERLEKMGCVKVTLRCQYRCHPAISGICSKMFYNGQLQNGVTKEDRPRLVEWLPPLSIVDIYQGEEKCGPDGSYYNEKEAEFTVKLVNDILQTGIEPAQIGVITQYKAQVFKIQALLGHHNTKFTVAELKGIQISTVDAFQGAEKDIIVLSCVRSRFVGFINCPRRTNVALSRAKHHLVIAGNLRLLRTDKLWSGVLYAAESQEGFFARGMNPFLTQNGE